MKKQLDIGRPTGSSTASPPSKPAKQEAAPVAPVPIEVKSQVKSEAKPGKSTPEPEHRVTTVPAWMIYVTLIVVVLVAGFVYYLMQTAY